MTATSTGIDGVLCASCLVRGQQHCWVLRLLLVDTAVKKTFVWLWLNIVDGVGTGVVVIVAEDTAKDASGIGDAIGLLGTGKASSRTKDTTASKLLRVAVLGVHDDMICVVVGW